MSRSRHRKTDRQLRLLFRDALGRFLRLPVIFLPRRPRPARRPRRQVIPPVTQLVLF